MEKIDAFHMDAIHARCVVVDVAAFRLAACNVATRSGTGRRPRDLVAHGFDRLPVAPQRGDTSAGLHRAMDGRQGPNLMTYVQASMQLRRRRLREC